MVAASCVADRCVHNVCRRVPNETLSGRDRKLTRLIPAPHLLLVGHRTQLVWTSLGRAATASARPVATPTLLTETCCSRNDGHRCTT